MRTLYSVLFYALIPFIVFRLLWRSIKAPDYRRRWRERFGFYTKTFPQGVIWFHAVSVGEAEALFPLVRLFQRRLPTVRLLITTTTPTGSARVKAVLKESVEHVYLPYDIPVAVGRFIQCFRPALAVIVETEIWPNLYGICGENAIPLYLINARLSEKSSTRYQKIPNLIRSALSNLKMIAAQTDDDFRRFAAIGASSQQLVTLGNIKFDIEIAQDVIKNGKLLKANAFIGRFVWIAGSTHQGEEQIILGIYQSLKKIIPELLLLLAPRHPERFNEVKALCESRQLAVVTRTANKRCDSVTDVYLADTMGDLKLLYAASDLAFIGGSLVNIGGHNMLEAAAAGVPVLFGPYTANFKEIAEKMIATDAAIRCLDEEALAQTILQLYSDSGRREILVKNGMLFLEKNRGATEKLYELLMKSV